MPRPPRTGREALSLAVGLATGVLLRRMLVRQWRTEVVGRTPGGAYRACLRSALIDAAACLLAACRLRPRPGSATGPPCSSRPAW